MTSEERFAKTEENLLVQAEIVARFERRTEERMDSHEAELAEHRERMAHHEARMAEHEAQRAAHEAELAEFRATVARVLDILERFVAGQPGPNGH